MKASTIRGIHSILSGAFAAAQRWEWTDRNPAESAKPPTTIRRPIPATSPDDVAKVIAEARARSAALGLYLWLVVVTGVRRGELCGLQIGDVDLDRGLVHVAFNYVVRGGQRVRKDTKTHQDRWLAIDPDTCTLIAAYLDETAAALAAVGAQLTARSTPSSPRPSTWPHAATGLSATWPAAPRVDSPARQRRAAPDCRPVRAGVRRLGLIQALLLAARTLQERGGDMILPSAQPIVARMLSVLSADQIIQVQLGAGTRPEADRSSDRARHWMSWGCHIAHRPQARGRPGTWVPRRPSSTRVPAVRGPGARGVA